MWTVVSQWWYPLHRTTLTTFSPFSANYLGGYAWWKFGAAAVKAGRTLGTLPRHHLVHSQQIDTPRAEVGHRSGRSGLSLPNFALPN